MVGRVSTARPSGARSRLSVEEQPTRVAAPERADGGGGILRGNGSRARRPGSRVPGRGVHWRLVLVADAPRGVNAGAVAEGAVAPKNPCLAVALALRDLRLWLLTYELVMIPLRFSAPGIVILSSACTVLDILVDLCEVLLNETSAVRANLPLLAAAQLGVPPPASQGDDDDDGTRVSAYSTPRMLVDVMTIVLLHTGRALYALSGYEQLFVYAQIPRLTRVVDLGAHVQALNSNLATNVTFLSVFKFGLVLLSVPHWCARAWRIRAERRGASGSPAVARRARVQRPTPRTPPRRVGAQDRVPVAARLAMGPGRTPPCRLAGVARADSRAVEQPVDRSERAVRRRALPHRHAHVVRWPRRPRLRGARRTQAARRPCPTALTHRRMRRHRLRVRARAARRYSSRAWARCCS